MRSFHQAACLIVLMLCGAPVFASAQSEVFQYAVPGKSVEGKELTAFLWVPPQADRIRGVLVGGYTLMEPAFATDPRIRTVCAEEKLAIVFFSPPIDAVFNYKDKGAGELLETTLKNIATTSGYKEIAVAPLFSYGHSVSSIFAGNVAYWKPERCFGVLGFKGGLGSMSSDPVAHISSVPALCVKGQFEEFGGGPNGTLRENETREASWKGMRGGVLARRKKDPNALVSLIVEPGGSHFAWSEKISEYVAQFLKKSARARIPEWSVDATEPVKCIVIKPESGALTSKEIFTTGAPAEPAANYADFKGDKIDSLWHLDLELAKAHDAFHAGALQKKPQFVTFADVKTSKPIFVGHDLRLRLNPTWTGPDTFKVAGMFLDKAPDKYPKVESPAGNSDTPILFRVFCGSVEQIKLDEFRIAMHGIGKIRADILAFNPGDATFRYAEQQSRVTLSEVLKTGKAQKITSEPVATGPVKASQFPLKLAATSDSTLPVRFYVESGPAIIEDGKLVSSEFPKRADKIKLVVCAYQYGSAIEPLVQSAEVVKQELMIEK